MSDHLTQDETRLHKSEVVWAGRPWFVYIGNIIWIIGYFLLLIFVPDVRPGIIEIAAGILLGYLNGLLLGSMWPKVLYETSIESRSKPWISYWSIGATALPPYKTSCLYRLVMTVSGFAIFFIVVFGYDYIHKILPALSWPWVRPMGDGFESFFATMVPYMIVTLITISSKGIRWYTKLEA
ncbi:MAG: hypothetical protein ACYC0V_19470 [Armatimonadota bacterium]